VAAAWDRHSTKSLSSMQDALVREQVRHVVGAFSPYWKQRFAEIGIKPSAISGAADLLRVPAVGERDVGPTGDPAGMAALVLQASEAGYALHAQGPTLRRALRLRATRRDAYRRLVEKDTKPTTYVWSGLGFRYPLASTRGDLDAIARAGARMWRVLGLTGDDALLSAWPADATTEHTALQYAALASGSPALFPGAAVADVVTAARLAPPTVVAVASATAAEVLGSLAADGQTLDRLRTVVLVGAPSPEERAAAQTALAGRDVTVLAVHAAPGGRVLWAECRAGGPEAGLHTYPDLDLVQLVDAETGEAAVGGPAERSEVALLRWRTGDLAAGQVDTARCPGCRRRVPRLLDVRRGAMVLVSDDGHTLDLRSVAGALSGRTDLRDWRVVVGGRRRDGRRQVLVHLAPAGDPAEVAVGAAADIRALAGILPTQIVSGDDGLSGITGEPLTPRILRR
jgi:phenylacetate-coenzyme A ligase PaaK-like adenylate-forming protein